MAMAMQSGIGISKVLFIAGAGYTGTLLIKNGKLSDIIGELQLLVKGLEKSGDQGEGEGEIADAIAAQVRRLAHEVRQIASNRQVTVLNPGSGQSGILSSYVVPAAVIGGVAGYGYMWWKGISLSDFMYVTKRNMETAVADLTKKLHHASDVIADAKRHLTQRIQKLDDRMRKQNDMARSIKNDVSEVRNTVTDIHDDLNILQHTIAHLDGRLNTLSENQDFANRGLDYIIHFIKSNAPRRPDSLQGTIPKEQPKLPWQAPRMITYQGTPNLKGLKDIAESLSSLDKSTSDSIVPGGLDKLEQQRRPLLRVTSTKC